MQPTIAFIGAGNMAQAMIKNLRYRNYFADKIWATAQHESTLIPLVKILGIQTTTNNLDAAQQADIIILAVKPKVVATVCQQLSAIIQARQPIVVSIAAGIRCQLLSRWLDGYQLIIRAIPNTPVQVGAGFTGLFAESNVNGEARQKIEQLLQVMGETLWVNQESGLSVVTALAGSSPAYFFYMIEMLEKAGQAFGLAEQESRQMVRHAAFGAAKMALTSRLNAQELKRQVTSPQGTTERAISIMQKNDFEEMMSDATKACFERSETIADEFDRF